MTERPLLGTVDRSSGTVRLARDLPASRSEVWAALTEPGRLAEWLCAQIEGTPAEGATFVLQMDTDEQARCTVTTWRPDHELGLEWDYTGEGVSSVRFQLDDGPDRTTRLTLVHDRLAVDPVQYGAGWHVYLDRLDHWLTGQELGDFTADYQALEPRYAAAAG
jgi:uncharacterized protein YndB with AHSA1/START domain